MAFAQLISDLGTISASLQSVTAEAEKAVKSVSAATDQISAAVSEASAQVTSARSAVTKDVDGAVGEMDRLVTRAQRLTPDLELLLSTLGGSDRPEDKSLYQTIQLYREGIGNMSDLTRNWIGLSTSFKGELHSVTGLLNELLPTTGQIQQDFRDFLKDIRGRKDETELILSELKNSFNNISQGMANLAETILAGGTSVDKLIEQLHQLRRAGFGGSEADILGGRLAELLDDLDDSYSRGEL